MTTAALAKTGVEAVIEGLGEFTDGFGIRNSLVGDFGRTARGAAGDGSLLGRVFDVIGESLRRIAEFVVAGIILRGIEAITNAIRDMIGAVFDAASTFQGLQVRLENFVALDIFETGEVQSFADALAQAGPLAEDLFDWMQRIAITTPFSTTDIADAFTMARAWGFANEEAKNLTLQVIDFTAGMGLGGLEMDRVIKALGQMKSLGRVAGQELLQLANAGVPVADIMENIRLELGLTTDQFQKLRQNGGVSAEMFFNQWELLVNTRFAGSAERMSRTLQGVISNVKDLAIDIVGLNVVKPVLDVIADKFANVFEALTTGERGDKLLQLLKDIGGAFASLAESMFGGLDADAIADSVIRVIDTIRGKILGIVEILKSEAGATEKGAAILSLLGLDPGIAAKIEGIIEGIKTFISEKIPEIKQKFEEIATFIREDFMPAFEKISGWVVEHGPTILKFIAGFTIAWNVLKIAIRAVIVVVGIILSVMAILSSPILFLITIIPILVGLIVAFKDQIWIAIEALLQLGVIIIHGVVGAFVQMGAKLRDIAISSVAGFVSGFIEGIINAWNAISPWIGWLVSQIKGLLGISSPSKLFAEFGKNINEGLAQGIVDSIQLPAQAMDMAVQHVVSAGSQAMMGNNQVTNNNTQNLSLTVNSQARTEPIVADFKTLKAFSGAL